MMTYLKRCPAIIYGSLQLIFLELEGSWRIGPSASPSSSRDRSLRFASSIQVVEVCKPREVTAKIDSVILIDVQVAGILSIYTLNPHGNCRAGIFAVEETQTTL